MATIYEKIAEIMKDIEYLSKDDKVEFGNTKYKAVSEEKVTTTVRKSLIKHGLIILPVKQEHKREGNLSTVDVTYRIVNTENPEEYVEVVSSGTGSDTQDKGVGKAMTYAYKYMMLRTFAIPTGEDPDKIASDELDKKQAEEEAKKAAKQPINKNMVKSLRSMFEENQIDEAKVLVAYKVDTIEQLTVSQYAGIVKNPDKIKEKCGV